MPRMHRLVAAALFAAPLCAQTAAVNPEPELGTVRWQRDFDAGLAAAAQARKPVFLLFQEIPGCGTCTGFGKDVLGHALLVPAIEQCFVPVVVRNNVDGKEAAVRERFAEPAWNNPVVRFVDANGDDLLPRKDGVWDVHGIATRMVDALQKAKRPVPGYLLVARDESDAKVERAVFEMHCFWEGEAALGALDGVVATRSAFVDGAEVVEVTFRPAVLTKAKLTEAAQGKSCKPVTGGELKVAPASDQQHALGGTPYGKLALTPMQRTKVHAALTLGTDANVWLTPAQVAALASTTEKR
jgi:hypothetical protein